MFRTLFLALLPLLTLALPSQLIFPIQDQPTQINPPSPAITRPLIMGYYPDWASDSLPPDRINYALFDVIDFAFALPDPTGALTWDDPRIAPSLLTTLVSAAHANNTKVKLSIGGWTGSRYFSSAVATPMARKSFVDNILATYSQYELDGIDIDWEYPAQSGDGGNQMAPTDSENMLLFLQLLRQTLPPNALITAAVQTVPFAGPDGKPMKNVSEFAKTLDWVLLMNYDTYENTLPAGPNAALYDGRHNSRQPQSNVVAAFGAWTKAGFPAHQLVLGVPSYGYVVRTSAKALKERDAEDPLALAGLFPPHGRHRNVEADLDLAKRDPLLGLLHPHGRHRHSPTRRALTARPADISGQIQFRSLVSQGILVPSPPYVVAPSSGYTRVFDTSSGTPFLFSTAGQNQIISYDDPESLAMKAEWVTKVGMRGLNIFDLHGDTEGWDLTAAVRRGAGLV